MKPMWRRGPGLAPSILDLQNVSRPAILGRMVEKRPADLPDYRQPPVDEVAIGIQFHPIVGFSEQHLSQYWEKVGDKYPGLQQQTRIESPLESLTTPSPAMPQGPVISFGLPNSWNGHAWFVNSDDDHLIQVQNDRYVHNWRRREAEYPHFESLLDDFWNYFQVLTDVIESASLPSPQAIQVKVELHQLGN